MQLGLAKQILVAGATERLGAGAVLGGDVAVEAAEDDGGDAAVLAADQIGRGRGLVGDRDHGGLQLASVGVVATAPVVERSQPRTTDCHLGLP